MQRMVVGFLFRETPKRVVLIKKNRPAWQAGLWNGVGGHVKKGEPAIVAMRREFAEETGMHVSGWCLFARGRGPIWTVDFFTAFGPIENARSVTDEEVRHFAVATLPQNIIPQLRWLIPLALDDEDGLVKPVYVRYRYYDEVDAINQEAVEKKC